MRRYYERQLVVWVSLRVRSVSSAWSSPAVGAHEEGGDGARTARLFAHKVRENSGGRARRSRGYGSWAPLRWAPRAKHERTSVTGHRATPPHTPLVPSCGAMILTLILVLSVPGKWSCFIITHFSPESECVKHRRATLFCDWVTRPDLA